MLKTEDNHSYLQFMHSTKKDRQGFIQGACYLAVPQKMKPSMAALYISLACMRH
jgi:hypothetical protein